MRLLCPALDLSDLSWANAVSDATHNLLSASSLIKYSLKQDILGIPAKSMQHSACAWHTEDFSDTAANAAVSPKIGCVLMTGYDRVQSMWWTQRLDNNRRELR